MLALYRELLRLRSELLVLKSPRRENVNSSQVGPNAVALRFSSTTGEDLLIVVNFKGTLDLELATGEITRSPEGARWQAILSTEELRFGGSQELVAECERVTTSGAIALVLQAGQ
jgi:maltooligosyltrehalose trehalohydrolase